MVLGDPRVAVSRRFVEAIDPADFRFEPEAWAERWAACREAAATPGEGDDRWEWSVDPAVLARFRAAPAEPVPAPEAMLEAVGS